MTVATAEIETLPPQSTAITTGTLVPQPHGGALRYGGTNAGGPGTAPSAVRAACRESFYKRIPILEEIADNKESRDRDRVQAITALGRMGFGAQLSIEDIRDRLRQQVALIQELAGPEVAPVILERLAAVWR